MEDKDKQDLYRTVRGWIAGNPWGDQQHAAECIHAANMGRPDGCLVTNDNMWMFRQYRNSVSANPRQLVAESLACKED